MFVCLIVSQDSGTLQAHVGAQMLVIEGFIVSGLSLTQQRCCMQCHQRSIYHGCSPSPSSTFAVIHSFRESSFCAFWASHCLFCFVYLRFVTPLLFEYLSLYLVI